MDPLAPIAAPAPAASPWHDALFAAHAAVQLLVFVYAAHRGWILWRWWRSRRRIRVAQEGPGATGESAWPMVTVQLPIYNERHVVERLIGAAAALDYPAGRLEIQVLDDSTDDTRERAAAAVARHRARGIDVRHVRRLGRSGFKAGALAAGMRVAHGELFAVFDADFVPPVDFLRRVVPAFADPGVGMVQARWGHLNRGASWLTRAQAALLDAHFRIEQEARAAAGLFFNFNGSAGVWRRACIEDAGGWSSDTLTEDLDLSYRAQLRGWRFRFNGAVEAPAELPADMEAFKGQQRRWVRGSIETARKLLPAVLRAPRPLAVRIEGAFYLSGQFVSALLLADALLLAAAVLMPARAGSTPDAGAPLAVGGPVTLALIPALAILAAGRRAAGGRGLRVPADATAALILWIGLSLNNARAACLGLGRRSGRWERTAKRGEGTGACGAKYGSRRRRGGLGEGALALLFAAALVVATADGHGWALLFLAALAAGFGAVAAGSLARPRYRRTILAERRPRRALRVSTIPRACRSTSPRSNVRWAVAMTTQS